MVAVNLRTEKFDIRVDRKSKWGNPFFMKTEAMRDEVCDKYRQHLWAEIKSGKIKLEDLAALQGKRLGCHCAPKRCHADILSAAADWAHAKLQEAGK